MPNESARKTNDRGRPAAGAGTQERRFEEVTPGRLFEKDRKPALGIAYSGYTAKFLRENPGLLDYVEVPYELLMHDPSVFEIAQRIPVVLHCASMSIAGSVPVSEATVSSIRSWLERTGSPWLGEHLSFIIAERSLAGEGAEEYAPGEPYNIGYTVHPPMNAEAVETVVAAVQRCRQSFEVPLLLENPPLYFDVPGSRMGQTEFVEEIVRRSGVGLLLDLAHFCITAHNSGLDARAELERYPLERVVEIHVSGIDEQEGVFWDNHATTAPPEVLDLLEAALLRAPAKAITLEYNWSLRFPGQVLLEEVARIREAVERAA